MLWTARLSGKPTQSPPLPDGASTELEAAPLLQATGAPSLASLASAPLGCSQCLLTRLG